MAADVLGDRDEPLFGGPESGAVHRVRLLVEDLRGGERRQRRLDLGGVENVTSLSTVANVDATASRLSTPHSPHPVGPVICRRRATRSRAAAFGEPHAQLDAVVVLEHLEARDIARAR